MSDYKWFAIAIIGISIAGAIADWADAYRRVELAKIEATLAAQQDPKP